MHIDCDSCVVRGKGCGDCVVTFLLGGAPPVLEFDETEQSALAALAAGGLVPPLRMMSGSAGDRRQAG